MTFDVTPLETQYISEQCRAAHGEDEAWDEAVLRLRMVYGAQLLRHPTATLALTISRSLPVVQP
jgi:hypothetical protein